VHAHNDCAEILLLRKREKPNGDRKGLNDVPFRPTASPLALTILLDIARQYSPATFFLYSSGLWRYIAAASPFRGSIGLGYVNNWGRKDSKIFDKSETRKKSVTIPPRSHSPGIFKHVNDNVKCQRLYVDSATSIEIRDVSRSGSLKNSN